MRIKDGLFEDHWDVIEPEATEEESKSKFLWLVMSSRSDRFER
jgi:predicted SnoaL-like aldol condensation-catalyzing enzyme